MTEYVPAPHRLEHCAGRRSRFHARRYQPAEWPPTGVVHLRPARYSWLMVAAALVGQAAPRLVPANPSPALGSPHRLWRSGAAVCYVGAWLGHLVGRRRGVG